MKKKCLLLTAGFVVAATSALAGAHWGYVGDEGCDHWAELDPAYEMCGKGRNQSPVDLRDFIEAELEPIAFSYTGLVTEVLNNGHTIEGIYTAGSTISLGGKVYELKQFHFHHPSENHIEGKSFPLEAHLVHVAEDGSLAVVAVMFEYGEENGAIRKLWEQMPAEEGRKEAMATQVRAEELLPENRDYYRYQGSLTTPPCTEGVLWLMMKQPMTVSKEEVERFLHVMHHPDNRPVQPLNARAVLK